MNYTCKSIIICLAMLIPTGAFAFDIDDGSRIEVPVSPLYNTQKKAMKQSRNLSGMICPTAEFCVIVSDEKRGVHGLTLSTEGEAGPKLSYKAAIRLQSGPSEFDESDFEAVAGSGDQMIFVGSHANKRKAGEPNPASHFIAIAALPDLQAATDVPAKWIGLDPLFEKFAPLRSALSKQLQCNGLNVEAATVFGSNLLIGLRSPTSDVTAFVVSAPLAGLADQKFDDAVLLAVDTGAPHIGIRAMETVGDYVALVTGDAGVNDLPATVTLGCEANVNKEDLLRPFRLRLWKPAPSDFEPAGVDAKPVSLLAEPALTFEKVMGRDDDDEEVQAKLEGIAVDPSRQDALFLVYDSRDTVRYLTGFALP